jgi:ABC-type multidrug transport system fused ATPase/permease subunit
MRLMWAAERRAQHANRAGLSYSSDWKWLFRRLLPFWKLQSLGMVCLVVGSTLSLLDPLIMKWLIDDILPHKKIKSLSVVVLGALFIYAGRVFFQNAASLFTFRVGQRLALELRVEMFTHLEAMSDRFFKENAVGDLVQRLERDVDFICDLGSELIPALLRTALVLVLVVITMCVLSWRLTAPLLPLIPLFLVVRHHYRKRLQDAADAVRDVAGKQSNLLTEVLSSVIQIQLLGCQRRFANHYATHLGATARARVHSRLTELEFSFFSMVVITSGAMTILGYGGYQVITGTLTIGSLVAFYGYVLRLFDPLSSAIELFARTHRIQASLRRLMKLRLVEPDVKDLSRAAPLDPAENYELRVSNGSFGYQPELLTIKGINTCMQSGETLFIVGASGSGKSTVVRLLARLYDVTSGSIEINGSEIRALQLASLRAHISVVPQEPILFSMTLRGNLLLAKPEATEDELCKAAETACLTEVVRRLPEGWDELLGPLGSRLSGGERQRVALARAILQDRPILMLDEATSSLDAETEGRVLRNLRIYAQSRLFVVVSHRLVNARLADRILVMHKGQIVEDGTHADLLRREGRYAALWRHGKDRATDVASQSVGAEKKGAAAD